MSKITDKQKIDYLFKKKQNLGFTDLDTNNNFQPLFENRNYILGRDILSQDLPSVSDLTSDISITNNKVNLNSDNFYNSSLSSLKSDRSGILLKVEKLKLIKVPNTSNSWYCLDIDGNNFLTPVISSNYGVKDGTKMADYQLEVYSKKGLDRFSRGESYLANELLRTCDYIFDYNTGILLLTDNCKDNEGGLINNSNPPYMTFFKYIGTTGAGSGSGSGTGSGGQWTKNVDDDIYFENGSVLIGTTTKSASLGQIDLEVDGNVYISGNLEVSGNVIKRDELHVYGDISANAAEFDEVDICGNLNVAGLLNGPGETTFVEYKNYNDVITFDQTNWYCIARTEDTNTFGGRDNARGLFILDDYTSGERQQIIFYAGVTHSRGSYINVIANNWYDTNPPITKMKIMVSNNASLGANLFIYREAGTTSNKSLSVRVYQNRKKQNNPIEGGYWKLDSSPHTSPSLDVSGVVLDIDYNPNQKKANAVSSLAHYFQDSLKIASDLNVEGKSIFQNVSGADASFNNVDINDDLNVEGKSIFQDVSGADASFNNVDINDDLNVEGKSIFKDVSLNKIGTATTDVSNIIIDGNLVPFNNEGYDLGSSTNSWRDLYLSNNSIIFKQEGSNNEDDIVSIGIDTTDDGDGTTYTLQLNIKGKDDQGAPAKKVKLAKGKVRQTTNNGITTRKAETFLEDASFNNIQGTIVTAEQNSITTMTGLTNVGTSGNNTVFASDISGADASFNKIDGTIVTTEQNSITTMTGLSNIGTSGNNTVFASDISGADASFNKILGTVATAAQNLITTMTGLTNVGTSGNNTVFASDISGADASFNKIDGTIVTTEQNSITTMTSLTNVGTSGSKTVFASDISGADASFNNLNVIGNKLNAKNIYLTGNIYQNGSLFSSTSSVNKIGQSFFDIITQQPSKFKFTGTNQTATDVRIEWSYEDILANQTDTILAKLSFQSAANLQNLPHINQIQIDISGNVGNGDASNNQWLNYRTIPVTGNYINTNNSNTINKVISTSTPASNVEKILSKDESFDARVYGINYAEDYPIVNDRALIFKNLKFERSFTPPAPTFVSENAISSDNQLIYYYNVSATEIGRSESNAVIIGAISDVSQNETLSSSIYPLNNTPYSIEQSLSNIEKNTNFAITLNSLKAGTKYNYKVKVKNNINDNYSDFSTQQLSEFLRLPENNSINTTVNLGISNTVSVSSPNLDGTNGPSVVYINSESSLYNFNPSSTSNQTIQITKPFVSTQQNETVGYGKWVDNSENLVKVECYVDGQLKQHVAFHGFDTTDNNAGTATRVNSISNSNNNFFDIPSQQDIWDNNDNKKGFRIKGTFKLKNILNSDIINYIGAARSTPHTIQYKYIRHRDVGVSVQTNSVNVYIDTLLNDPTSTNSTTTATVKSVIWTMGIPSVKKVDIDFERTYNNINSEYQYIKGDRKIARVSDITKINKPNDTYIYLARTTDSISGINNKAINTTGSYTYTSGEFAIATSSYYHDSYYDESVGVQNESGTTLTSYEQLYSLRGSFNANKTFTVDHHFDRDSYNSYGGSSINRKLSATDFYEISNSTNNISRLGSDIGSIELTQYTTSNRDIDHQKIPQDWTLLYYKGKFRTNANITYPNVNNYEWNSIVTTNNDIQYSAGTISYDLSGNSTNDNSGYKWIVFNLNESSGGYDMMGLTISIDKNYNNTSYLDLKTALSNFFNSSTVDALFNISNNNAVGFCRATKKESTTKVIGSFTQRFLAQGGIWTINGTGVKSYNDIKDDQSFGAIVDDGSNGKGIYIDKDAINDDLKIFIGLKNSWNETNG